MRAYHFVDKALRDGSPIPPDGEWLEVEGEVALCARGLHASLHVADACIYAPGNTLCLVELDGTLIMGDNKVCASRRKILARFDAEALLLADARASALSVIHLGKVSASLKAYLESEDESIGVAAYIAVASAAWVAASYAHAYAAVSAASAFVDPEKAGTAAKRVHIEFARARLQTAVNEKFSTLGF